MTASLTEFKSDDQKKVIDLVNCNTEICSVIGLRQSLVEVDMIRFPLINTPLQRGGMWARISELFQQFHYVDEALKPLKRLRSAGDRCHPTEVGCPPN